MADRTQFDRALSYLKVRPTAAQTQLLERYVAFLREWNRKINLVSRRETDYLWTRHVLPSIAPLAQIDIGEEISLLDVGSGGGFPAIPLKILRPDLQIVMVESVGKKARFLNEAVRHLGLNNTFVYRQRLEEMSSNSQFAGRFQWLTARAVAGIPRLLEWGAPFLQKGGKMLLWKGTADIPELESACRKYSVKPKIYYPPPELREMLEKMKNSCWFLIPF